MKLEAGKRYVTAGNVLTAPLVYDPQHEGELYPFVDRETDEIFIGVNGWAERGEYYRIGPSSPFDLVSEYIESVPVTVKKEDRIELATLVPDPCCPRAEVDPTGLSAKAPGAKLDAGKTTIVRGGLQYFPNAISAVADLSRAGAAKYSWGGWREVPDGFNRYTEALGRHLAQEGEELFDSDWDSRNEHILHATAVAWNALARLELKLKELS